LTSSEIDDQKMSGFILLFQENTRQFYLSLEGFCIPSQYFKTVAYNALCVDVLKDNSGSDAIACIVPTVFLPHFVSLTGQQRMTVYY